MSKIIDRTKQSLGRNVAPTRTVASIRRCGIHHSATGSGNTSAFENTWRNQVGMGAPNAVGGYHEVILLNGDVEINYLPTQVSYGVGGQNADTYNICVVGNFTLTSMPEVQRRVLLERIRFNVNRFPNLTFDRVLGHNEFPNQATACPAINMTNIRRDARQVPTTSTPASNAKTHTVKRGETLSGIAKQYNTTVKAIQDLNGIKNANLINVGQVLKLPSTSSGSTSTNSTVKVGSRVRVNSGAKTWATGQSIPTWVKGQTYTVQQLRNNNNELLLTGIMSWIRRSDVTVV